MEKEYINNISQRIIERCNILGFEPDPDEIKRKIQRLIEEFGVSPSEVEKSVTQEQIKKYESSMKKTKILKQISEHDLHNLDDFLSVTKPIDMDIHWLITVASLSAQEIAIKRKLFELTGTYIEGADFQKTVTSLTAEIKKRKQKVPNILLTIGRSYTPIRAKILHDPNECQCSKDEAELMVKNTTLLIKTLFKQNILQTNVIAFFKTLNKDTVEEKVIEFSHFEVSLKKQIFENILEKLALSHDGINKYSDHFVFLKRALVSEMEIEIQKELLQIILSKYPVHGMLGRNQLIFSAISELTSLESIRIDIRNNKLIDPLISEFRSSGSYADAGVNTKIIFDFLPELNDSQLNEVIDAAINNRQIYDSVKAVGYLRTIITASHGRVSAEKIKRLEELISR